MAIHPLPPISGNFTCFYQRTGRVALCSFHPAGHTGPVANLIARHCFHSPPALPTDSALPFCYPFDSDEVSGGPLYQLCRGCAVVLPQITRLNVFLLRKQVAHKRCARELDGTPTHTHKPRVWCYFMLHSLLRFWEWAAGEAAGRTGCFPERDKFPNQQRLERDEKVTETSWVEGANANEMFGHAYGGITPFSPTRGDCTRERETEVWWW